MRDATSPAEVFTLSDGDALTVRGARALNGSTVAHSGQAVRLETVGAATTGSGSTSDSTTDWYFYQVASGVNSEQTGIDTMQVLGAVAHSRAGSFRREKIDVSQSFTIDFDYLLSGYSESAEGYPGSGIAIVFHNNALGCSLGAHYQELGYGNSQGFTASVAIGLDVRTARFAYAVNGGSLRDSTITLAWNGAHIRHASGGSSSSHVKLEYDAGGKTLKVTFTNGNGGAETVFTQSVDLATSLGATTAYFGFTGGSDAYFAKHEVSNIRFSFDPKPAETLIGGTLDMTGGETASITLAADESPLYVMDAFSASGAIAVANDPATANAAIAFRNYAGGAAASVVKSGNAGLTLFSATNAPNVSLTMAGGELTLQDEIGEPVTALSAIGKWNFAVEGDTNPNTATCDSDGAITFGLDYFSGNRNAVIYNTPVKATSDWKASWTMDMTASQEGKGLSVAFFMDDPEHVVAGNGNTGGGFSGYGIQLNWCIQPNSAYMGKVNYQPWDNGYYDAPNWANGTLLYDITNNVVDIEVTYTNNTITVDMTKDGETRSHSWTENNIARYFGNGDYAYFGFGTSGGGSSAATPTIRNFRFEKLGYFGNDEPYLNGLVVAVIDAAIEVDVPERVTSLRTANTTVQTAGSSLLLTTAGGPVTNNLGTVSSAGDFTVAAGEGITAVIEGFTSTTNLVVAGAGCVFVKSITGLSSITVDSGTVVLPAQPGDEILDARAVKFRLASSGHVAIEGDVYANAVYVDGVKQKASATYVVGTEGAPAWLTGVPGKRFKLPGGLMIIVR